MSKYTSYYMYLYKAYLTSCSLLCIFKCFILTHVRSLCSYTFKTCWYLPRYVPHTFHNADIGRQTKLKISFMRTFIKYCYLLSFRFGLFTFLSSPPLSGRTHTQTYIHTDSKTACNCSEIGQATSATARRSRFVCLRLRLLSFRFVRFVSFCVFARCLFCLHHLPLSLLHSLCSLRSLVLDLVTVLARRLPSTSIVK